LFVFREKRSDSLSELESFIDSYNTTAEECSEQEAQNQMVNILREQMLKNLQLMQSMNMNPSQGSNPMQTAMPNSISNPMQNMNQNQNSMPNSMPNSVQNPMQNMNQNPLLQLPMGNGW
jgi:hypothetical protein